MKHNPDPWFVAGGALDRGADLLARYREEVLRWNEQTNLISRVNPVREWERLIAQSLAALAVLPAALGHWDEGAAAAVGGAGFGTSGFIRLRYVDVGSGVGVPGLAWHLLMTGAWGPREEGAARARAPGRAEPADRGDGGIAPVTTLVEARAKRAWFIDRCVRELKLESARSEHARWGESQGFLAAGPRDARATAEENHGGGSAAPPSSDRQPQEQVRSERTLWLISLKALRLTDPEILRGWRLATLTQNLPERDALVIARLRGPDPGASSGRPGEDLRRELALPDEKVSRIFTCEEGSELPGTLQISFYRGEDFVD